MSNDFFDFDGIGAELDAVKLDFVPDGDQTAVIKSVNEVTDDTGKYWNFELYYPEFDLTKDFRHYLGSEEWNIKKLRRLLMALQIDISDKKLIRSAVKKTTGWTIKIRHTTTQGKVGSKHEGKTFWNKEILSVIDRDGSISDEGAGAFG